MPDDKKTWKPCRYCGCDDAVFELTISDRVWSWCRNCDPMSGAHDSAEDIFRALTEWAANQ